MSVPYKSWKEQSAYRKGYYAGWRLATICHLGGKCVVCGEDDPYKLTISHNPPLNRRARSEADLKDLSVMEVRCKAHHDDWGKNNKKETKE